MNINIKGIVKAIGPGILFAGAAIGGSHLIQSTRAGADYGYSLLLLVILANLFKYPFFEFGYRYTVVKQKSLLEGYKDLGNWALWSFLIISVVSGIINIAALALGSSGLLSYLIGNIVEPLYLSIALVLFCITILMLGKYPLLDLAMKIMVLLLAITTTIAFFMSFTAVVSPPIDFQEPDLFAKSGILFVIALMGWMPAPIEASVWTSLWSLGRQKQKNYLPTLKESLFDFHLGYIGTTILAVFFLFLGANIMHGSGISFSANGTEFSKQLIDLYTSIFGKWSAVLIAPAAFITLFSSLITVIDAYPRSITAALKLLKSKSDEMNKYNIILMIFMSLSAIIIVSFFVKNLKSMMDLATVLAFLAAPVFAILNYKTVMATNFPENYKPNIGLRILAIIGLIFLVTFSLIYIWSVIYL